LKAKAEGKGRREACFINLVVWWMIACWLLLLRAKTICDGEFSLPVKKGGKKRLLIVPAVAALASATRLHHLRALSVVGEFV
jgi:hypothetical protein